MFRVFQRCCVFLTGMFLILHSARCDSPSAVAVPAKGEMPKPPVWVAGF